LHFHAAAVPPPPEEPLVLVALPMTELVTPEDEFGTEDDDPSVITVEL
jgi:hypothetical protein